MDASKATINDIFNGIKILEIPYYQRAYVWGEDNLTRFLSDMEETSIRNEYYFLGSVILKQQMTSTTQSIGDVRTIIDGQQRLTSIALFFKVYSLKVNDPSIFSNFQLRYQNNDIAIRHNHLDKPVFNRIVNLTSLEELSEQDNITLAYEFFRKKIDVSKINFLNILTKTLFVAIDLNNNEDEQQIFDTINSLGVTLTSAELLKNYLFNRQNITDYETYWKPIFENSNETREYWDKKIWAGRFQRTYIDLFFFAFIQIKIQEEALSVSAVDKILYSKVDSLFNSYKNFIAKYLKGNTQLLMVEIMEYASIFKDNFHGSVISSELTDKFGIERINALIFGLDSTTLIPYVLYVLKNAGKEEQIQIFEYLESYMIRRMVCHAVTKNYNQLFTDSLISNKIIAKVDLQNYINNKGDKINYMPNDIEFKGAFHTKILINKQTLGILYLIESKIRDRQYQSTALLGLSYYTLEHLMPKKWRTTWPAIGNKEQADEIDKKLLTLGNLAIIPGKLNTSISNGDWLTKRNGKNNKPGLLKNATSLETLSQYLESDCWNVDTIDGRASDLFNIAKEIWKV